MSILLLLSGPVAVGKSEVATILISDHEFKKISSGSYLSSLAASKGIGTSRQDLQVLGDSLDEQTDFRWLIYDVAAPMIDCTEEASRWLIDSVRKIRQVEHFRNRFKQRIFHVHLTANERVIEDRYSRRLKEGNEYLGNTPYNVAKNHPNELAARNLSTIADATLDLGAISSREAAKAILDSWEFRIAR